MRGVLTGPVFAALFGALILVIPAAAEARPAGVTAGDEMSAARRHVRPRHACNCRPVRKVRRVYRTHTYAFYPRPVWGPVHDYVEPPPRQPLFPYEPFLPPRYW